MAGECSVYDKVRRAFSSFLSDNRDLLVVRASERSISHKIAECLQREFDDLSVDCEYNRRGKHTKRLGNLCTKGGSPSNLKRKPGTVFPDIVVHRRNTQSENVLVIEIKKSDSKRSHDKDIEKLKAFTCPPYAYQIGLFLVVGVGDVVRPFADIRCVKRGKEETGTIWRDLEGLGYGG